MFVLSDTLSIKVKGSSTSLFYSCSSNVTSLSAIALTKSIGLLYTTDLCPVWSYLFNPGLYPTTVTYYIHLFPFSTLMWLLGFNVDFNSYLFRPLEPPSTDANCHGDICPCNICPGDMCPFQEYLSCYNFAQTFWTQSFWNPIFGTTFFWTKILFYPNYFGPKTFFGHILFQPNFF